MSKVEEAIIAHWGERCADTEPGCPCCDAWIEYDAIRANALRDLDEVIRGWRNDVPMTGEECANAILALLNQPKETK